MPTARKPAPTAPRAKATPKPPKPAASIQVLSEWPPFEFSGWTLEHVQAALDALGRGDLRYPEQLLLALEKDPAFAHGRRTRCRSAAATPCHLEFPDGFPKDQAAELMAHMPDLWGSSYVGPDGVQLAHALAAGTKYRVCLGVAPCAVDWALSASGKTWLPTLHARSAGRLRFNQTENRYQFTTREGMVDVIPDGKKWLLFRELSSNYPHQEALLRALAIIVWFKQATVRYWANYNSVHGTPQRKVKVPGKQREGEDVRKLAEQVRTLMGGQVIILPQYAGGESFDVSLLEALATNWETFPKFIEYADKWITLCWLGAWDNTQGDAAGSRARAEVHEKVSQREMGADCDSTASALRVLFRQFCDYNRIDPALAPALCFDTGTVEARKAAAEVRKIEAEALTLELANARVLEQAGEGVDYAVLGAGMPLTGKPPKERPGLDEPPPASLPPAAPPTDSPPGAE